jgi:hypothetical protein
MLAGLLLLLLLGLSVWGVVVLVWGAYFCIFTRWRKYGLAVLAAGCVGGTGALFAAYLPGLLFALPIAATILLFCAGFAVAGSAFAVIGFFAPALSYNNRWSGRRAG